MLYRVPLHTVHLSYLVQIILFELTIIGMVNYRKTKLILYITTNLNICESNLLMSVCKIKTNWQKFLVLADLVIDNVGATKTTSSLRCKNTSTISCSSTNHLTMEEKGKK